MLILPYSIRSVFHFVCACVISPWEKSNCLLKQIIILKLCETRKPLHAVFEQTTMVKNMYSHRWVLEHLSPNLALAFATDV